MTVATTPGRRRPVPTRPSGTTDPWEPAEPGAPSPVRSAGSLPAPRAGSDRAGAPAVAISCSANTLLGASTTTYRLIRLPKTGPAMMTVGMAISRPKARVVPRSALSALMATRGPG